MVFVVVPNVLCAAWIAFEIWLVVRDRMHGRGKTEKDRGTVYYIFLSVVLGVTAAGLINGYVPTLFVAKRLVSVLAAGTLLMLVGLGLRIWSVAALGSSFRTTVETHHDQMVVDRGPYRLVRHPSYGGLLLLCVGYALSVQNWLSLIVALLVPLPALLFRIHVEEQLLVSQLGPAYASYRTRTKRLIPWIW
jgi:protein-S-isoprenylcysteine O-methyltransferase Ste14